MILRLLSPLIILNRVMIMKIRPRNDRRLLSALRGGEFWVQCRNKHV